MTYVLSTIGDRTYLITEEQVEKLDDAVQAGLKFFAIGKSRIFVHQITTIDPMDTYLRQMKTKLAAKQLKMCKLCMTVVPLKDACPCKDDPKNFPDILSVARQENPPLARQLDQIAAAKALPSAS